MELQERLQPIKKRKYFSNISQKNISAQLCYAQCAWVQWMLKYVPMSTRKTLLDFKYNEEYFLTISQTISNMQKTQCLMSLIIQVLVFIRIWSRENIPAPSVGSFVKRRLLPVTDLWLHMGQFLQKGENSTMEQSSLLYQVLSHEGSTWRHKTGIFLVLQKLTHAAI